MRVMYFDNAGNMMDMEASDCIVKLSYCFKKYVLAASSSCYIFEDKTKLRSAMNKSLTKGDKFVYDFGELVLDTTKNPALMTSWTNSNTDLDESKRAMLRNSFDILAAHRVNRDGYIRYESYNDMGHPYYYHNIYLDRLGNTVAYLTGTGTIVKCNIINSLIYVFGDYEVI